MACAKAEEAANFAASAPLCGAALETEIWPVGSRANPRRDPV
jgi:hypothetical protein